MSAGFIGGIVGMELACLAIGLRALLTGGAKLSQTKTVRGTQVRLGALILMLPLPLTFLVALLTQAQQQESLFVYFISVLVSTTGLLILGAAVVIGMALIYTSPE